MRVATHDGYEIHRLTTPEECAESRADFIGAYQTVFSNAPYFQRYSPLEAEGRFKQLTQVADQIMLVARKDGEFCGFASAVPLLTQTAISPKLDGLLPLPYTYYLAELGILPDHRRHGLGRAMVAARLRLMDTSHYSHVVLRVSASRNASYLMYTSMGFDDMGVYMEVSGPRTDGHVRSDRRLFLSRMISQVKL